ncbi:MAG: CoA-binding protein [Deltaproteobacteria bacterium]|nr:CoA-binding protein [Deltaproteobacteria bacterium]
MVNTLSTQDLANFEKIFHPQRVAIVGVSAEGFGFGSNTMMALQTFGFKGEIFPVNPKGGTIRDLKIYPRIEDIPGEIDFGIIAVQAPLVPKALEDLRKKGAVGAEILSAGFKELATEQGRALEDDVKRVAKTGIRVIGPNCFGIYCPKSGLTLPPGSEYCNEPGTIAFLAQSGGMANDFIKAGKWLGLRFSKVVSFGNGADLREAELLQYLAQDPDTKVICMYIEGVGDGTAFFNTLKKTAMKKPVIIYKGGLSEAGNRAVASHTASMGGSRMIWESVLSQANAVKVANSWEMSQAALAFTLLPERSFKGITVAGGGGALGVTACDTAEALGIHLPMLKKETQEKILSVLPKPGSSALNPIDVANPGVPPEILREVLFSAAEEESVDLQILIQLLYQYKAFRRGGMPMKEATPYVGIAEMSEEIREKTGKPVVLVLPNNVQGEEDIDIEEVRRAARTLFLEKKILPFENLPDAFTAISRVNRYYERREVMKG